MLRCTVTVYTVTYAQCQYVAKDKAGAAMAVKEVEEALATEILSTRALSYRRAMLAIGFVLAGLLVIPGVDFKTVNVFGVHLKGDESSNKALVLVLIGALLAYHGGLIAFYGRRDWLSWVRRLTKMGPHSNNPGYPGFPEIQMFFGKPPRTTDVYLKAFGEQRSVARWSMETTDDFVQWWPDGPRKNSFAMPVALFKAVRKQVRLFRYIDCGMPLVLVVLDLGLLLWALLKDGSP
jgi:hypothetical protein